MDFLNDHDPGVGTPVGARKGGPVLELDPIDEVDQGGGIILFEITALAEPPERMNVQWRLITARMAR
jgi:hypothetical protein